MCQVRALLQIVMLTFSTSLLFVVLYLLERLSFLVFFFREDRRKSHYIINKIVAAGVTRFRIGDQDFPDLPTLLQFYKTHYLDTTPLTRPVALVSVVFVLRYSTIFVFLVSRLLSLIMCQHSHFALKEFRDKYIGKYEFPGRVSYPWWTNIHR